MGGLLPAPHTLLGAQTLKRAQHEGRPEAFGTEAGRSPLLSVLEVLLWRGLNPTGATTSFGPRNISYRC